MAKPGNIRWRILLILLFCSFTSYTLRYNVSTAAPAMLQELQLTEIQWGWVLAAFTTGYALFQFPGGIFGDRVGPRRALALIATLWCVLTLLTALVPGADNPLWLVLLSLITIRFLVGLTHAPIYPVMNVSIRAWFPVGGWAFPLGLTSTALGLGVAASTPVLVWLISDLGWRWAFVALAPIGLLAALLWYWYSRDIPADHPGIGREELVLIAAGRGQGGESGERERFGWWRMLKNRNILLLTLSYFCMTIVFYEVYNWFYYYFVTVRGFPADVAGYITSFQWIAGAIGATAGGWLCDKWGEKYGLSLGYRLPAIIGMVLSGIFLVAGALSTATYVAMTCFILCFFFNQFVEAAYWATSIVIGREQAGTAGGILNTGGNISGMVGALLVPVLANSFGWVIAIGSGGVFALAGAVLWLFVRLDEGMPPAVQDEVKSEKSAG